VRKEIHQMPLTPDEVSNKKFSVAYGRGYSRDEVDEFLARISEDYSAAIQKIAVAAEGGLTSEDDFAVEVAEVLRAARESAQRIRDKAQAEADGIVTTAKSEADRLREEANTFKRETEERAGAEATKTLEEVRRHAEELREAADRESRKSTSRIQERYGALLDHEAELRGRIGALEKLVIEMQGLLEPVKEIDLTEVEAEPTRVRDEAAEEPVEKADETTPPDQETAIIWELQERLRAMGGGGGKQA
jgi:DivIVA domain-containing protein